MMEMENDSRKKKSAGFLQIVGVFNAIGWALALVLLPVAALFVMMTEFGQASDAARATFGSARWLLFFSLGLAGYAIASWGIMSSVLMRLQVGRKAELAVCFALLGPLVLLVGCGYSAQNPPETNMRMMLTFIAISLPVTIIATDLPRAAPKAVWFASLFSLGCWATLAVAPDSIGPFIGPLAALLVFVAIPMWAIWALRRSPILGWCLVIAVVLAVTKARYGVREVRMVDRTSTLRFRTMTGYAESWIEERRPEIENSHRSVRYPIYIVTSDGGGIRSSLWTAIILGRLTDLRPTFSSHIFTISAVSGGSVGAAVYAALLHGGNREIEAESTHILAHDLLSAPLARLVTRDPLDSVFCRGWGLCAPFSGDRAISLETALERAGGTAAASLAQPFENLWSDTGRAVPLVFFNTTDATSAARRVISPVWLDSNPGENLFFELPQRRTLRLSTAAMLSARFPIISPQGELPLGDDRQTETLVDGGYFDNSGSATASEALRALQVAIDAKPLAKPVRIVALMLTNDVGRPLRHYEDKLCSGGSVIEVGKAEGWGILQPVETLDAARSNSAERWRHEYTDAVERAGGVAEPLSLYACNYYPKSEDLEVPLGWMLSKPVVEQVRKRANDLLRVAADDILLGVSQNP
jgi:hypothetical protein